MKWSEERKLEPGDYEELCKLLAPVIVESGRNQSMVLPFEVHITGADDDDVLHASVGEDCKLRDLTGFPERPLAARFPLTATITDAGGNVRWLTIEPERLKH
jgi:hypothetical protein